MEEEEEGWDEKDGGEGDGDDDDSTINALADICSGSLLEASWNPPRMELPLMSEGATAMECTNRGQPGGIEGARAMEPPSVSQGPTAAEYNKEQPIASEESKCHRM